MPRHVLSVWTDYLSKTARAGRTALSDTREGTITITNFGVFGIDSGTPILNPGESVILGVGAIKEKPWEVDGQVVPRQIRSEEHTSELQSRGHLVCRLLLEKKKQKRQ